MNATPSARKTSKATMKDALDSFYWTLADVAGGTNQETFNQAPHSIGRLEMLASKVAELVANPSKLLADDSHLMDRAACVPARLAKYRDSYILPNVIQFPRQYGQK